MNLQYVKNILISRNLTRADLARLAGVSRAAVTKWFRSGGPWVNVETKTILQLAEGLVLSPESFLKPGLDLAGLETRFLWDHLYPGMEKFIGALHDGQGPALARLVQVIGFHHAGAVLGRRVLRLFPHYKKFLKPARRRQLELLWPLYRLQT